MSKQRFCQCAETLIERPDGTRVRIASPAGHDCAYVARRNKLVEQAAVNATEICGGTYGTSGYAWTQAFAQEMEKLCKSQRI